MQSSLIVNRIRKMPRYTRKSLKFGGRNQNGTKNKDQWDTKFLYFAKTPTY